MVLILLSGTTEANWGKLGAKKVDSGGGKILSKLKFRNGNWWFPTDCIHWLPLCFVTNRTQTLTQMTQRCTSVFWPSVPTHQICQTTPCVIWEIWCYKFVCLGTSWCNRFSTEGSLAPPIHGYAHYHSSQWHAFQFLRCCELISNAGFLKWWWRRRCLSCTLLW